MTVNREKTLKVVTCYLLHAQKQKKPVSPLDEETGLNSVMRLPVMSENRYRPRHLPEA